MTHHHDDPPVEHDPTGMRALLASLPDPGPMPEDLVARITAALAEESRSAAAQAPASAPDAGDVIPLRPRRGGWRHLGVAAAVVTAIGIGGVALSAGPGGLTAQLNAVGGASEMADTDTAAGAAESQVGGDREESSGSDAGTPLSPDGTVAGAVVVTMSGTDHASADLAATLASTQDALVVPITPLAAESPGIGPIATAVGARSCADALGISPGAGILVDVSTVDGAPAAVLVVDDAGARTAYAVRRSCTTGSPELITGPVSLG